MPFQLGFCRAKDCVVEHILPAAEAKREVNSVPGCKGVLACGYAVSIFNYKASWWRHTENRLWLHLLQ